MRVILPGKRCNVNKFVDAVALRYKQKQFVFFRIPQEILKEGTAEAVTRADVANMIEEKVSGGKTTQTSHRMVAICQDGTLIGVNPNLDLPAFGEELTGPKGSSIAFLLYHEELHTKTK